MITSMTGFGAAQRDTPHGRLCVEIRSVNNRFLELNVRMASQFSALDVEIRNLVKGSLSRGKVDVTIRFDALETAVSPVRINTTLLKSLIEQLQPLSQTPIMPERLLSVPGVMLSDTTGETEETLVEELKSAVGDALAALQASRQSEGHKLAEALVQHHTAMVDHLKIIDSQKHEVVPRFREKLLQRIEELLNDRRSILEPGRLELEVALFADKADITEEIQRFTAHLQTLRDYLTTPKLIQGKALEFLSQELLREVNTLGSKCRDLVLAQTVIALKQELESLRENLANVE
jgi:uncharacterized protein (TIGR00255 family)